MSDLVQRRLWVKGRASHAYNVHGAGDVSSTVKSSTVIRCPQSGTVGLFGVKRLAITRARSPHLGSCQPSFGRTPAHPEIGSGLVESICRIPAVVSLIHEAHHRARPGS